MINKEVFEFNKEMFEFNKEMFELYSAVPFTCNKKSCKVGEVISWNTSPRFFPETLKDKKIRLKYFKNITNDVGLQDLAMPDQPTGEKLIEDCHEITFDEFKNYYESDIYKKEGTIWNNEKNYTAIFMTKETSDKIKETYGRSVSLVFPAADCAVVRYYDKEKKIIGITHSDAKITTDNIIGKMTNYMRDHFNSDINKLEAYVGAFAHDDWIYNGKPGFAVEKDEEGNDIGIKEEWKEYIEELEDNKYKINYGDKIYDQLIESGINKDNINFDPANTLFNREYFSHSRSINTKEREGRNLVGITFEKDKLVENSENMNVKLK